MPAELQLFLSKVLPLTLLPEGLVTFALVGACLALLLRATRIAGVLAVFALAIFWLSAMPIFANWLVGTLERQYPPNSAALPKAELAIVLGGAVSAPKAPHPTPELYDASDRVWYAAHLYRSGHVKRMVVVGGQLPWEQAAQPEGEVIRDMLVTLGVPSEAIMVGTSSRNTYENATEAASILRGIPLDRVLLVTSAAHMPRALAIFRKAGFPVEPAPCDFRASDRLTGTALDWLPQASAFAMTSGALREWIGYYAYKWRGWL